MEKETLQCDGIILAEIIYKKKLENGVHFYTSADSLIQIGKLVHPQGHKIKAHKHGPVKIQTTEPLQEVLYIEEGKVKVIFYSTKGQEVFSRILTQGDIIFLMNGGHGFEILEKTVMLEVKQGPYLPENRQDL